MKPGDAVIHRATGQHLTVKAVHGGNMVLCCYMGVNRLGEPMEYQVAHDWQELRAPTPEDLAGKSRAAAREPQTITPADVGALPADLVPDAQEPENQPETDPQEEPAVSEPVAPSLEPAHAHQEPEHRKRRR